MNGTAGADTLNGSGSSDIISGLAGNDTIKASGGDDTITGGAGNDIIDGGAGTDTAVFSGNRANYVLSGTNGTITVKALSGTDGTDTLTNVEYLRFADGTVKIPAGGFPDSIASAPKLTVKAAAGNEDTAIPLGITAALTDTDGSETLKLTIAGVPKGAVLSAGTNNGNGSWTLTPAQLTNLTIKPAANSDAAFSLTVTATSTESNGGATASTVASLAVKVTGVADTPTLSVVDAHGPAGSHISLGIAAALTDTDGSEVLGIRIANVPTGATLSAGTNAGNGIWLLTPAQLAGLTITPPAGSTTGFALSVVAVSTEDNGTTATATKTLNIAIDKDTTASAPTLSVAAAAGNEDTAIPLKISAALTDTDGSESLRLTVAGVPKGAVLSAGTDNGNGSWTLTPAQLSNLTIKPPANADGTFTLSVTAISTESNGGATASTVASLAVKVTGVADAPTLSVADAHGAAGSPISLDQHIAAALTDADGSEALGIQIANVPAGATLSAGANAGNGIWLLTPAQLAGLTITPPAGSTTGFALAVTAVSAEDNGTTATATKTLNIGIDADATASAPTLNVAPATGNEDTAIPLGISAALTDTDGSETLKLTIAGVPKGAALSAGTDNGNGSWTLTSAQLPGLTITPPANADAGFTLTVTATSTESNGGATASTVASLAVKVTGVADAPTLSVVDAHGAAGSPISLDQHIAAALTDTDGSEALGIQIANVPTGATLSAGVKAGNGIWMLTPDQLPGLTITPPAGSTTGFALSVTAVSSEDNGTAATTTKTLNIGIDADTTASAPTLTVAPATGNEDTAIPLGITAALTDTDGSETLGLTIAGVPKGAALSAGIDNGNGSWTLTPAQLANLTITPPTNADATFTLSVTATSTESNGGSTASTAASLAVKVNGVADAPTLSITDAYGSAGSPISLDQHIAAVLADTDGSEALGIQIATVPAGAVLSAGANAGNGIWILTPDQLPGLTITPPPGSTTGFALSVTAVSTEDNGTTATATKTLNIGIGSDTVPAAPTLSVTPAAGNEDTAIPLAITAALTDTDEHETLGLTIAGVPKGAVLSAGTDNGNGSWTLTPAQLANLTLKPPANADGTFTLSVTATSTESNGGSTASTVASLAVKVTGVADAPTLSVADTHGAAGSPIALGIAAALTDTDGSEALGIQVANVPTGAVLSAGVKAGNGIWILTPDQLPGLTITPPAGSTGFALTVTAVSSEDNGTTATATHSLNVAIDGTTTAKPPAPPPTGVVMPDAVPQPQHPGDIVGVRFENDSDAAEAARTVTFGQVFAKGDLPAGAQLVALVNGQEIAVQMDVKATNDDGSVRHAVLSIAAPAIAAHGAIDIMLAKGTPAAAGPAIGPSDILARGYDLKVDVTLHNADGTTSLQTLDAASVLQQAIAAGQVQTWMKGSLAGEYRVQAQVTPDLRATFDIRLDADGRFHTDVIFANDHTYKVAGTPVYDVTISEGGKTVFTSSNIQQYPNSTWHEAVTSDGSVDPHVVEDVNYLIKTGAIPSYDTSTGVSGASINTDLTALAKSNTGPLGNALVTKYMPGTGGRPDIGFETAWTTRYLLSQDASAEKIMLANADAAGSIPWHFRDEATGQYVSIDNHPKLWIDYRGASTAYGADALPVAYAPGGGWAPETAHTPSLSYVPYLITGSHYYLDELQAQASWELASVSPAARSYAAGLLDGNASGTYQVRAQAWILRDLADAAYISPDGSPLKSYFEQKTAANAADYIKKYVTNDFAAGSGQLEGYVEGNNHSQTAPWQQDFLAMTLTSIDHRGLADTDPMLSWMSNFVAGRFLSGDKGYDPFSGAAYWLNVADPTTGQRYSTWQDVFTKTYGTGTTPLTHFVEGYPDLSIGYVAIARASLADLVTQTGSPDAIEAFGFVVGHMTATDAKYQSDPTWSIAPQLPDGSLLTRANIHVATGTTGATLTGGSQSDLLYGTIGNDTIIGGSHINLLFGDAGNDTLTGGADNDFLYGGDGNDRLVGGGGNDYLKGGHGADAFVFSETSSGHDTIGDFAPGQDHLEIKQNLNGNNLATAADVIAAATADASGNAILHFGGQNDVVLLGVSLQNLHAADIVMTQ
jgi:hypothetical protein